MSKRVLWAVEWKSTVHGWIPYLDGIFFSREKARQVAKEMNTTSSWRHRVVKYEPAFNPMVWCQ